jgi:hypothetical protein
MDGPGTRTHGVAALLRHGMAFHQPSVGGRTRWTAEGGVVQWVVWGAALALDLALGGLGLGVRSGAGAGSGEEMGIATQPLASGTRMGLAVAG